MIIRRQAWFAIAIFALAQFYPHGLKAETFTGKTFLSRSVANQDAFIQTSVTMAALFSTRVDDKIAACINDWYFGESTKIGERNALIRATVGQYQNNHPSGVIVAVLEQQCGPFKR